MSDDGDDGADPGPGVDDAPLGDLVREIRAKQAAREEGADAAIDADLFEPVEVDEVDDEVVWEAFTAEETGTEEQVGLGADPEETSPDGEAVVPKRQFCQRCPHFTDPPETACTHEGTSIVEVVDATHFRVRNCPVVAEERESSPIE
ncbi:hypothetical protein ACFR97_02270 [Haloplanus litoreus]|uniref:DUF8135 domain-containing protein n=1 Tax=Haloplanus litoreus TaxID=767515 RepID=A0ABD6A390_9EURY